MMSIILKNYPFFIYNNLMIFYLDDRKSKFDKIPINAVSNKCE